MAISSDPDGWACYDAGMENHAIRTWVAYIQYRDLKPLYLGNAVAAHNAPEHEVEAAFAKMMRAHLPDVAGWRIHEMIPGAIFFLSDEEAGEDAIRVPLPGAGLVVSPPSAPQPSPE